MSSGSEGLRRMVAMSKSARADRDCSRGTRRRRYLAEYFDRFASDADSRRLPLKRLHRTADIRPYDNLFAVQLRNFFWHFPTAVGSEEFKQFEKIKSASHSGILNFLITRKRMTLERTHSSTVAVQGKRIQSASSSSMARRNKMPLPSKHITQSPVAVCWTASSSGSSGYFSRASRSC